ncbi:MAG: hypothetical protein NWP69_01725, partial [Congregibacter sp.]|nr:hypothetical protein [Congregibacter sp.]
DVSMHGDVHFDMLVTAYETNGDESFVHGQVEGLEWVMRQRQMRPMTVGQTLAISASHLDVVRF